MSEEQIKKLIEESNKALLAQLATTIDQKVAAVAIDPAKLATLVGETTTKLLDEKLAEKLAGIKAGGAGTGKDAGKDAGKADDPVSQLAEQVRKLTERISADDQARQAAAERDAARASVMEVMSAKRPGLAKKDGKLVGPIVDAIAARKLKSPAEIEAALNEEIARVAALAGVKPENLGADPEAEGAKATGKGGKDPSSPEAIQKTRELIKANQVKPV